MLLQARQRLVERAAHTLVGLLQQVRPARLRRHVEGGAIPVGELDLMDDIDLARPGLLELGADLLLALLEDIRAALQEEHAEDVFLELRGVHAPAQDVGGLEEVPLQLVEGEDHTASLDMLIGRIRLS